ncbi:MAG: hypothetical protein ACE37F_11895 [Nannocystaceae bacterium]|nr:hypothetical protein [bacterium]
MRAAPSIGIAVGAALLALPSAAQAAQPETTVETAVEASDAASADDDADTGGIPAQTPPRLSGPYLGLSLMGTVTGARVNRFGTDAPFAGGGGFLRFGQFVLPWFGLGLSVGGTGGVASDQGARQSLGQGGLLVDFEFVPAPRRVRGLSLRTSFGFGGGAITEEGLQGRSGYGGALFGAGVRYAFFPGIERYRSTKAGGFGIGPELGWLGFTPAAAGRPMSNTFYAGLSLAFYFGD